MKTLLAAAAGSSDGGDVLGAPTPPDLPTSTFDNVQVFSFEHEQKMLIEPFYTKTDKGIQVYSRACVMGNQCQGRNEALNGNVESRGGVVLTETLSPGELSLFLRTGQHPEQRRCCILCNRFNLHAAYLFARKQKTFPSSLIINWFVNTFGQDQYDSAYMLPIVGDSQWHGIQGAVVGLHLNRLQLRQNAQNRWFVDQSDLKTKNGFNAFTSSLYPAVDPRIFLYNHFKSRPRVADCAVLFGAFDIINSQRPKFSVIENVNYFKWPEAAVKSFIHRLVYYRLNRLNDLLTQCGNFYGQEFNLMLTIYIDAHIPMARLMMKGEKITTFILKYPAYEHTLPDFGIFFTNASMNCIVPPATPAKEVKTMKGKHGTYTAASLLIHALVKLLPEFSNPKLFRLALIKCMQNTNLAKPVFNIIQCAMLGNYIDSRERLPFYQRYCFITELSDVNSSTYFANMSDDDHFLFFAFRHYLHIMCRSMPALHAVISSIAPLDQQSERVSDALRVVRQNASSDWTNAFCNASMEMMSRVYKRSPKRKLIPRGTIDMSLSLTAVVNRSVKDRNMKRSFGSAFSATSLYDHYKRARTILDRATAWGSVTGDAHVAEYVATTAEAFAAADQNAATHDTMAEFQAASQTILTCLAKERHKKPIITLSADTISDASLCVLNDFAEATDVAMTHLSVPLPLKYVDQQLESLAKRFDLRFPIQAETDWASLLKVTTIRMCLCCGATKNFVLTEKDRIDSLKSVRSAGFKKLTIDANTGDVRCAENPACLHVPLARFELISRDESTGAVSGAFLVARKQTFVISPCCGFICTANAVRTDTTGINCPACCKLKTDVETGAPDMRLCSYCNKRVNNKLSAENMVMLRNKKDVLHPHTFCKLHFRSWARTRNGYLDFEFVSVNMQNRNGNGLVINAL